MTDARRIRGWKVIAALVALFAILFLLLPQATGGHVIAFALFTPIFLFCLPSVLAPQRIFSRTVDLPLPLFVRPTLFQRPPPAQA
jgi:hypothetical protein